MKTILTFVGALVLGLLAVSALGAYAFWSSAFVLIHLWSWFVVPTFGLPALSLLQAMGLAVLVSYMTYQHVNVPLKDERELKDKLPEIAGLLLRPWLILLSGWLIHLLMVKTAVGV